MPEEKKTTPATKAKDPRETFKTMNIYQKLILARKLYQSYKIAPTGYNDHANFNYFELGDIIPTVTEIFDQVGLIAITNYHEEQQPDVVTVSETESTTTFSHAPKMELDVINTDNPEQVINFTIPFTKVKPIISRDGKQVTSDIQAMGSALTYHRRYLYLIAMDIAQSDEIDKKNSIFITTETSAPAKPKTAEERKEIVSEQTSPDNKADEALVQGVKRAIKTLLEKAKDTASANEVQTKMDKIVIKTSNFENMTKEQAEKIIAGCKKEMEKLDNGMAK